MKIKELLDHSLLDKKVFFLYSRTMGAIVKIKLNAVKGTLQYNLEIFDSREAAEKFMEYITIRDSLDIEIRHARLWDYLKDYYMK